MWVILLNILKDIWWMNIKFGLMDQCDTKIDLKKYVQVNDLYCVVLWFCLISWLSTVNYFYKLNNDVGWSIRAPPGTCSSFLCSLFPLFLDLCSPGLLFLDLCSPEINSECPYSPVRQNCLPFPLIFRPLFSCSHVINAPVAKSPGVGGGGGGSSLKSLF